MAETKTLIDGTEVPWETRTRNTNKGYVLLTQEEIDAEDARTAQYLAERAAYEASEKYALEQRRDAYVVAGATVEGVLEALFEMIVENRPEKAQAMNIKRQEIKALFPKPTE